MITMHHFKRQFHPMSRSAEKKLFLQSFLPLTNVWDANKPMAKLQPASVFQTVQNGFFILSINIRKLYLCTPEVLLTVNCKCYCHYMYISKLNAYIKSFRIKIISSNIIFLSFYLYSHCVVFLSGINAISFKVILYLTASFFSTDRISIFDDNSIRSMLTLYYKIHSALSI